MTRLDGFQDLVVWQRARELTKRVYFITRLAQQESLLLNELRALPITMASKIAAAYETRGTYYAIEMLGLAKAAANGFKLQLTAFYMRGLVRQPEYEDLLERAVEIRQLLFELEYAFAFWYGQNDDEWET